MDPLLPVNTVAADEYRAGNGYAESPLQMKTPLERVVENGINWIPGQEKQA